MALTGPPLASPVDVSRLLDKGLAGDPDDTALISLETSWTWQELAEDSARLAGNLLGLGLKPGDRVASLMPNRCALLVFYLACLKAGLVATPIPYRATPADIDRILEASGASLLLVHRERAADLAATERVASLAHGVVGFGQGSLAGARLDDFIEKDAEIEDYPEIPADAPCFLLFGGAPGTAPRGILHCGRSLGWSLASLAAGYRLEPGDIVMNGAALSHYGGIATCLAALASGCRVAIARNDDAEEILPLMRAEQPSLALMLPSSMVRLVRDYEAGAKDFASLRHLACGGGQVPRSQLRIFERQAGIRLTEPYGMVELGPVTSEAGGREETEAERVTGAVGQLLPGFAAEIRNEVGYLLPAGMPGRLWIRSPSALLGYWSGSAVEAAPAEEGFLDSAETMRADRNGTLILTGNRNQVRVEPNLNEATREVEAVLADHPDIAAAAAVLLHDLLYGEMLLAYVVLAASGEPPREQELIAFARSRVGFRAPEQVLFVEDLPLDGSGQLDRDALRQMTESGLALNAPSE